MDFVARTLDLTFPIVVRDLGQDGALVELDLEFSRPNLGDEFRTTAIDSGVLRVSARNESGVTRARCGYSHFTSPNLFQYR
jgi:hypothetical protein